MGKAIGRFLILASGDERTYRCLPPYSQSNLLPYSQAAGPPYCSPPAWAYASPPAANWRRDTDRWWRQLTRLPRPFPQYPPLTLRYGTMRLLCCASGAACAGQWPWVPARTFDVIVLTEQRYALTPPPCISVPQAVHASKAMPQQSLTCILTMSGSLSHCLSRCRRTEFSESELKQDAVENDAVFSVQLIPQPLEKRSLLGCKNIAVEIISIRNPDPASITSADSFNRI